MPETKRANERRLDTFTTFLVPLFRADIQFQTFDVEATPVRDNACLLSFYFSSNTSRKRSRTRNLYIKAEWSERPPHSQNKRDISIRMSFSFCFFCLRFHLLLIFFCTATEPVTRPWGRYTKQRDGLELVRGDSVLFAFVI